MLSLAMVGVSIPILCGGENSCLFPPLQHREPFRKTSQMMKANIRLKPAQKRQTFHELISYPGGITRERERDKTAMLQIRTPIKSYSIISLFRFLNASEEKAGLHPLGLKYRSDRGIKPLDFARRMNM